MDLPRVDDDQHNRFIRGEMALIAARLGELTWIGCIIAVALAAIAVKYLFA